MVSYELLDTIYKLNIDSIRKFFWFYLIFVICFISLILIIHLFRKAVNPEVEQEIEN